MKSRSQRTGKQVIQARSRKWVLLTRRSEGQAVVGTASSTPSNHARASGFTAITLTLQASASYQARSAGVVPTKRRQARDQAMHTNHLASTFRNQRQRTIDAAQVLSLGFTLVRSMRVPDLLSNRAYPEPHRK